MSSYITSLVDFIPHQIDYLPGDCPSNLPDGSCDEIIDHLISMVEYGYNNGYLGAEQAERLIFRQINHLAHLKTKPRNYPILLDKAFTINDNLMHLYSYSR